MKNGKRLGVAVLVTILLFTLPGCGSSQDTGAGQGAGQDAAQSTAAKTTAAPETEVIEQAVTEQIAQEVDAGGSVSELTGNWVDIAAADRFANITVKDGAYQYEDNEGKYPADFVDGVLKVKISDTDTADVYIDTGSGNLKLVFQDNISEFKRKK